LSAPSEKNRDIQRTRKGRVNIFAHWLGCFVFWIFGWKAQGPPPPHAKYVALFAPHTSYWDLPVAMAMTFVLRVRGNYMAKDTVFRGPLGWLLRILGGIAIERSHKHNTVEQVLEVIRDNEQCIFAITPEGTRKKVEYWKTGFYQIALQANIPIVLAFLDYKHRAGGNGGTFWPSGDVEADLRKIQAFYDKVTPRNPERWSPPRFRPEAVRKIQEQHQRKQVNE
jgi:1-acyl-sn-glycerol-3-phosphate acyltransferase